MSEQYSIPEKDEMREAFGLTRLGDEMYNDMVALISVLNDYDGPVAFEHALLRAHEEYDYSISPDDDRAGKNHKNRIDRLGEWNPEAAQRIVGRIPRKDIWTEMALSTLSDDEITGNNMHTVQQRCIDMSETRANEYNQANAKDIQERVIENVEFAAEEYDSIGEFIDDAIEQATVIASKEIPDRIESRKQGTKSSGGSVNEEIVRQALRNEGIEELDKLDNSKREYFTCKTNDADLTVVHTSSDLLRVEVKSSNLRERAGRAGGAGNNWILLGFVNDAASLSHMIEEGNNQRPPLRDAYRLVYAPESVVTNVNPQTRQQNRTTFLRPINQFPGDMSYYLSNGTLP